MTTTRKSINSCIGFGKIPLEATNWRSTETLFSSSTKKRKPYIGTEILFCTRSLCSAVGEADDKENLFTPTLARIIFLFINEMLMHLSNRYGILMNNNNKCVSDRAKIQMSMNSENWSTWKFCQKFFHLCMRVCVRVRWWTNNMGDKKQFVIARR